jgi:hypothetical protein
LSFLLRILFSGLIAVIPSEDGHELTVLLLNVEQGHHLSDGSKLTKHKPLLIARAESCSGNCPTDDCATAQAIYRDKSCTAAIASLLEATGNGGGAWQLSGSELSVVKGSPTAPELPALSFTTGVRGTVNGNLQLIPTDTGEREDFSWVSDLDQICPSCEIDAAVLGDDPPPGLIAARLRLRSGNVFTWSVGRLGGDVKPVYFKRLDGTGSTSSYTQAVTSWLAAEIEISGSDVQIVEEKFDESTGRSMTLSPDSNGLVEVAVLNMPPYVPPASADNEAPQVGKHFEHYYDLFDTPPASESRLVPRVGAANGASFPEVTWQSVHPTQDVSSTLLTKLRLDVGRGPYDRVICPITQDDPPPPPPNP